MMGMFLISFTSALIIYSGECRNITFPNTNDVTFEVSGNSTDMEGFNWTKNGTLIEYCFDINYKSDNMTLRWYNHQSVEVSSGSSGGGGLIIPKITNQMTKTIPNGGKINFEITGKHTLKILNVIGDIILIELKSEPQIAKLNVGVVSKFSIEKEGYYDISILADRIYGNKNVRLTITKIDEKIEKKLPEKNESSVEENIPEDKQIYKWNNDRIIEILLFIIVVCLVVIFWIERRKFTNKNGHRPDNQ